MSISSPDGIEPRHYRAHGGWRQYLPVAATLVLAAIVLAGLLGLFGLPDEARVATTRGAKLQVYGPRRIRNGEFFEMRIQVSAEQTISKPVIAVDADVWKDLTINTMIPAPSEEEYGEGYFEFTYSQIAQGESFLMKVDGQINPDFVGTNSGAIQLRDGERTLASVDYTLAVLP